MVEPCFASWAVPFDVNVALSCECDGGVYFDQVVVLMCGSFLQACVSIQRLIGLHKLEFCILAW